MSDLELLEAIRRVVREELSRGMHPVTDETGRATERRDDAWRDESYPTDSSASRNGSQGPYDGESTPSKTDFELWKRLGQKKTPRRRKQASGG